MLRGRVDLPDVRVLSKERDLPAAQVRTMCANWAAPVRSLSVQHLSLTPLDVNCVDFLTMCAQPPLCSLQTSLTSVEFDGEHSRGNHRLQKLLSGALVLRSTTFFC